MGSAIDRFLQRTNGAPTEGDAPGGGTPGGGTPNGTATSRLLERAPAASAPPGASPDPTADTRTSRLLTGSDEAARLRLSVTTGQQLDADQAARVLRLTGKTGLPEDLVARNLDAVEAEARRADFDPAAFRASSPIVARWLAENPNHAAVAGEDLTRLSYLERQLGNIRAQFGEGRATVELSRIGEAAIRGTVTPAQRARQAELEQAMGGAQTDFGITGFVEGIPGAIANQLPILGATLRGKAQAATTLIPHGMGIGAITGATGAAAAGQAGPQAALPEEIVTVPAAAGVGALTGGIAGGVTGWRYGVAVEAARMEASLAYLDYEKIKDEHGQPLDRATMLGAAAIVGAVNGGLESVGLESMLKAVPGLRSLGRAELRRALMRQTTRQAIQRYARVVGEAMLTEGATEAMQSLVTNAGGELATMVADGSLGKLSTGAILDRLFSDEALAQAVAEGRAGAQAGGGMTATAGGVSLAADVRRARAAQQHAAVFQAIGDATRDATLTARLPEKLQEVVEQLTRDGPVETVYTPIETWEEYWQSQQLDPGAVAEEVLGSRDAYEEALRTGGDLAIPTARYAVTLAPSEHNTFFVTELRFRPDAMTAREAREFAARMDAMEREQSAAAAPVEEPAASVGASVAEQLAAAGFDESTAQAYAEVYQAAFRTLGQRAGVDPLELFQRFGLQITRPDEAPAGRPLDVRTLSLEELAARAEAVRERQAERAAIQGEAPAVPASPYALRPQDRDADARSEDGSFVYARDAKGDLRRNLATVHTDGLIDEIARLFEGVADDQVQAVPSVIPDENFHTTSDGRAYVGMKPAAVRATGRMQARQKAVARFEAELARRGVEDVNERVWARMTGGAAADPTDFDFDLDFAQGGRVPGQAPLAGLEQGAAATETEEERDATDRRILARQVPPGEPGVSVERRGGLVRVAARDEQGQPIALLSLVPSGDGQTADVLGVYVVPERRRQGLASALYDAAEAAGYEVRSGQSGFTAEGEAFVRARSERLGREMATVATRAFEQSPRGPIQQDIPLPAQVTVVDANPARGGLGGIPDPVASGDRDALRNAARAYAKQQFQGKRFQNAHTGWRIDVSKTGIAHIWSGGRSKAHAVALANLDALIQHAVFLDRESDRAGRKDITAYYRLYAPMRIGEEHYLVRIGVRETQDGRKVYDQLVIENERPAGMISRADATLAGRLRSPVVSGPLTLTIDEFLADVNAARAQHPLFQGANRGPRGRIRIGGDRQMAIDLFATADLSTFLHETGHFYLEVLGDLATGENPAPDVSRDYATILTWLGVENRSQITREHHEQFARGFEAYLFDGQAPTSALRASFARFRAWLVAIYRRVAALNVELSPEVRGVFDRLLATEEEIAAAQAEQGMVPLFADPAAVGMTEAQAERYRAAVDEARRSAEETLAAQLVAQVRREQTAVWKAARAKVRAEVAAAVNQEPASLALAVLSRGTLPDGSPLPEGLEPVKLSQAALLAEYADRPAYVDLLKRLPRPYLYAREGGLHPDDAAVLFGFDSGDALLQALLGAEAPRTRIERLTDERMRAEFEGGDLLTSGELPVEAMKAVHNERRAALLRSELEHLASTDLAALKGLVRKVTRRIPTLEAVRAQAEQTIARKRVREINPLLYQRAEAKAAKAAVEALLKGDVELAFEEKQRELLNHELYRVATRARETVDGIVDDMRRFDKPSTRARLGKAGGDYLAQIDAIRERYDFARGVSLAALDRRRSLLAFVREQEAAGQPITVPESLLAEARRQHYRDTTLEELVGIRDAVRQIEHLARTKNRLLASARARELADARAEIVSTLAAHHDLAQEPEDLNPRLRDRLVRGARRFAAEHTRMEFFFRFLDGGAATGTLWQYLFKPMADAEAKESEYRQGDAAALARIFGAYTPAERRAMFRQRLHLPEASTGRVTGTLTKANLLAIALNWGNAYNRDALLRGYGWTEAQVERVLRHLDARDWATVQAVWDHLETYWPAIAAQEEQLTGLPPEKVEATPFTIRDARNPNQAHELRGGYYPIKFDGDLSTRQASLDEKASVQEMFGGNWARAMTRHGHTIARTDTGGKPLRLELGVIAEHLAQVAHDLAFRPAVLDVSRLIRDPEIQGAIEAAAGRDMYRQLNPWLVGIAGDRGQTNVTGFERVLGHLRMGATVVGLGFRVTTALVQTLGFLTTVNEIGARAAADGLRATLRGGPRGLARQWRFIEERSAMMRERRTNFDRDVRDYVRQQPKIMPDSAAYFTLIGWLDMAVSIPTWLGAYRTAMDGGVEGVEGGHEPAAIDYADMVVRTTQAAGSAKDLAQVQRGGELMRLFTMYYSSLSILFNQFQQTGQAFARTKNVPRLVASLTLLWFLPAVLDDLLKGRGPDDEDDEGWAAWLARQELLYPFGTLIGVRDVASAVDFSLQTGQRSFEGSPAFGAGEALVGTLLALVKAVDPDEDLTRRDLKDLVLTVGYLAKLPTSQAWTTAEYVADVLTGRTAPDNPAEFFWRAASRGTPREDR